MSEFRNSKYATVYIAEPKWKIGSYKIEKIDSSSVEFPERLRHIPGPPGVLYCAGDISLLKERSVAMVGSRRHTAYGKNVALMIGRRLAEHGIIVTSGLALGIDAYSHEGALDADGRVIGVLGGGIEVMGPQRNKNLMMRGLDAGGLVVSEYEPTFPAQAHTFPARNRIISGLSDAVVVVEAGMNSGTLITSNHAAQQGRTVYAVPGPINSQFSIGCNLLIRDGAMPLVLVDDLIRDLGLGSASGRKSSTSVNLAGDELIIYEALTKMGGATVDEIVQETGKSASLINAVATVMEIKGLTETYAGRIYISS
ncbi:MAG: DNA-processing protein DprA [Mogibacterium sp.]|nr:DNA-processing protein DprA [Mogibacterium sp.]